jgi:hypothetical protein
VAVDIFSIIGTFFFCRGLLRELVLKRDLLLLERKGRRLEALLRACIEQRRSLGDVLLDLDSSDGDE